MLQWPVFGMTLAHLRGMLTNMGTEHLATKADVARLDGRLDKLQWMAGVILAFLLLLVGMVARLLFATGG